MAAAPENDLKKLDAERKAKAKKLKKYKSVKKLKKSLGGEVFEVKAFAAADENGAYPLFAILEQCGYKNLMLIHGATGVGQAGSYRPAYFDQKMPEASVFDIYATDEAGFVLPRDDDNTLKDQSNLATITEFREKSKTQESMLSMNKIAWEKRGWKVMNKQARDGDKGGMIACVTTKRREAVKEGYFMMQDDNGTDYWQKYENGAAVDGDYAYEPKTTWDVEPGRKYFVTKDRTMFDALAVKSGTPYDATTWDALAHDVLGFEVEVTDFFDNDWVGYNVNCTVTHEDGTQKQHVLPIRALEVEDEGDTALFLGEVGMWILTGELQLFPAGGFNERGKNIQPLVSEFKGLLESLTTHEDFGYMEVVDPEEEAEFYNLKGEIQAWCTTATQDWDYGSY